MIFNPESELSYGVVIDSTSNKKIFSLINFNADLFAYIKIVKQTKDIWEVKSSQGLNGYGAYMYQFVLNYMHPSYVISDSIAVSEHANAVWKRIREIKKDIDILYVHDNHEDFYLNFAYRLNNMDYEKMLLDGKQIIKNKKTSISKITNKEILSIDD